MSEAFSLLLGDALIVVVLIVVVVLVVVVVVVVLSLRRCLIDRRGLSDCRL